MRRGFLLLIVSLTCCTLQRAPLPYKYPEMKMFPALPAVALKSTVEGVKLGRYLFYDPALSGDSSFSCASCHRQEFAFSDGPKRFSSGSSGFTMTRNTLPLFNLAFLPSYFWDGRAASLEAQVSHPFSAKGEMAGNWQLAVRRISSNKFYRRLFRSAFGKDAAIDSAGIVNALAQFERTLISNRSKFDRLIAGDASFTEDERDGFILVNDMTKGDCLHCHTTDANSFGTTMKFSNNGLDAVTDPSLYSDAGRGAITGNSKDLGKFRIPTLRNVMLTGPYMHDGRFLSLEEVIKFYSEGVHNSANVDPHMSSARHGGVHLTDAEQKKIIAFLKTLTDSAFVTDPAFSNPFRKNSGKENTLQ